MGRTLPCVRNARLSPLFLAGCSKPAGVCQHGRSEGGVLLPSLLREAESPGGISFSVGSRDIIDWPTGIGTDNSIASAQFSVCKANSARC